MKKAPSRLNKIASLLYLASDEKELQDILEDLLTPAEVKDIAERLLILEELHKGKPQRVVAKKIGVSLSKVTRGSGVLQYGSGYFNR